MIIDNLSRWSNDWTIIFMRNKMAKTLCENISNSQQNMLLNLKEWIHCYIIVLLQKVSAMIIKYLIINFIILQWGIFHPLAFETIPA